MNNIKKFDELPATDKYLTVGQNETTIAFEDIVRNAQKDAWNAALKWAAENAEAEGEGIYLCVDSDSILKGLID